MKVVIIGAVAGGTSAATEIRRRDKTADIVIYEKDRYISYSGCGMPYYLSNVFSSFDDLVPRDASFFKQKHNVTVQIMHEVTSVDPASRTLQVRNLLTGQEFRDSYDKLVIATGARAEKPTLTGSDRKNVFTLRNINDMKNIKTFLSINRPKKAAIIGSGPIGLEMAEALTKLGLKTTLIARSTVSRGLSPELTALIEKELARNNVGVINNASIEEFTDRGVLLKGGSFHAAEIILLATGVKPAVELAKSAGIGLGTTGAIKVDLHMKTSDPDIYACGDCAEYFHHLTGTPVYRPLGSTANKTGIIAGNHIAGGSDEFQGVLGTSIFQVFDLTVAQTGLSEEEAILAGYDVMVSLDRRPNKPEFMGGENMTIKTVADRKSGLLLGCQIAGPQGVDRRIDVMAAMLTLKGKAEDLVTMDLAYAPPYSTPKDPLFFTGVKLRQQR
jgi:NADPH-dependent 2,4-dienoyl-CoA reductase/sulfur reductase-like enzyme